MTLQREIYLIKYEMFPFFLCSLIALFQEHCLSIKVKKSLNL